MSTALGQQTGEWLAQFTKQPSTTAWVQELRDRGFQRFAEVGFPNTHDEEWRFTNVAPIARTTFAPVAAAAEPMGELPKGARLATLDEARRHLAAHALLEANPFVALNTAFLGDITVIVVERGAVVEQPIQLTYRTEAGSVIVAKHPRTLIVIGADAHCAIVETYTGSGHYFTNAVTEIVAGDAAVVDHYKVQLESLEAWHISTLQATLGRSTSFSTHSISIGGALVRNDVNATLAEGTDATLNGLYLVNGTQHVDNHTIIDHAKPHATSHELYKGILDDKAAAVFNGRIIVRKDAQKTDSKQTNKNLVLSDEATIDTKPELQIHADDVRCTHGATIGQLDDESMFYLQSRGIGKRQARDLLTYAFAQDIVDRIKVASLKDSLERILFEKFHEHGK
jgi:Fe-S cluster assembly protein SufD